MKKKTVWKGLMMLIFMMLAMGVVYADAAASSLSSSSSSSSVASTSSSQASSSSRASSSSSSSLPATSAIREAQSTSNLIWPAFVLGAVALIVIAGFAVMSGSIEITAILTGGITLLIGIIVAAYLIQAL